MDRKEIPSRFFKFGTWNVRGLNEEKKKKKIFAEIERENKDVVVLTETKLRGYGKEEYSNYIHVYGGVHDDPARAGVSVLVKKKHSFGMRWKVINERIIRVRLKVGANKIVIIGFYGDNVYARNESRIVKALKKVIEESITDEMVILGDFNAWVGTSEDSKEIGKFGDERTNNNGDILIQICKDFRLTILNTFFKHEDIRTYTWYDSKGTKTIIDFCIVRQDTNLKFLDVSAYNSQITDHSYVEALALIPNFSLNVYNSHLLFNGTIEKQYQDNLDSYLHFAFQNNGFNSAADLYNIFKKAIHSAATEVLGIDGQGDRSLFLLSGIKKRSTDILPLEKDAFDISLNEKLQVWKGICQVVNEISEEKHFQRKKFICNILKELENQPVTTLTADKKFLENYFKECRSEFIDDLENTIEPSDIPIPVTLQNIKEVLNEFEDTDLPSPGGISMRLLKHGSYALINVLLSLIQAILGGQTIPEEINEMFFFYQSGDEEQLNLINCSKCVSHTVMQVMSAIIRNSIKERLAFQAKCKLIHEVSCLDATFILRRLLLKRNIHLHLVFINLEEAFLDVPRINMINELQNIGIEDSLVKIVEHLYKDNTVRMIFSSEISNLSYPVSKGLKKDCSLSPTLFNVYIRRAIKDWLKENDKKELSLDTPYMFSFLSEQTNLVVLSDSQKHLSVAIESLLKHLGKLNLQISFKNIKYLGITEDDERKLKIGKKNIVSEDSIEFLGSVLERGGGNAIDIKNRIIDTKNAIFDMNFIAHNGMITDELKKYFYQTIIENSLTFGCETWLNFDEDFQLALLDVEMFYCRLNNCPPQERNVISVVHERKEVYYNEPLQYKWPKHFLEWCENHLESNPERLIKWTEG
nr:uncharacterized protein LOC107451951 [Parasteatoda tepidariorum]XP_042907849.1 uncharacterized protein LOC107451951 [Parasteatoda tepidariorum]